MKILLPTSLSPAAFEHARKRTDVVVETFAPSIAPQDLRAMLADADGIGLSLNIFGRDEIAAAPRLRAVARHGVGYDTVDVSALTEARIPLLITGTANAVSVAEHALGLIFALTKRVGEHDTMVRQGRWADRLKALPAELADRRVLIVGFGGIGRRLAARCHALDMKVRVFDQFVAADAIADLGYEAASDLTMAVHDADIVSIHCPLTPETAGLFGTKLLAAMKPGAVLVNTARGGIVDEDALADALRAGHLAGAALDVFAREPLPADAPLLSAPNLIVAPHIAGLSREAMVRMGVATVDNILSVLDGRPLVENVVNKSVLSV